MRIAYFSPLPPIPSGIADYSGELLPHLEQKVELTLFVDAPMAVDRSIQERFQVRSHSDYPKIRSSFDLALYHMGNNIYHEGIYPIALRFPGVVVLHDMVLHHFIGAVTFMKGDFSSFVRELEYSMKFEDQNPYLAVKTGRKRVAVFETPLHNRIIDRSLGLIVHSRAAAKSVRSLRPERPLRVIPHLLTQHGGTSLRESLGISIETTIFASLGFINATKQIGMALKQFARLLKNGLDVHYLIVGGVQGDFDLEGLVEQLGLGSAVSIIGYSEDLQTFLNWLETADVVLNLRYPTTGETSGVVLRAMGAGKPIIVFDHGWYSEIPDEACLKVPPMDEEALFAAMTRLVLEPTLRGQIGEKAAQTANTRHHPGAIASNYIKFLEDCLSHTRKRVLNRY